VHTRTVTLVQTWLFDIGENWGVEGNTEVEQDIATETQSAVFRLLALVNAPDFSSKDLSHELCYRSYVSLVALEGARLVGR